MDKVKEKKVSVGMAVVAMIVLALVLIGGFIVLQISTHVVFSSGYSGNGNYCSSFRIYERGSAGVLC